MPQMLNAPRTVWYRARGCCNNANLSYFDDNRCGVLKILIFDAAASSSKASREQILRGLLGGRGGRDKNLTGQYRVTKLFENKIEHN